MATGLPSRDFAAGLVLKALREDAGLSPEQMPFAMLRAGLEPVSGKTIRRIERGAIPQVRVKFALAHFFDRNVSDIWMVRSPRVAA